MSCALGSVFMGDKHTDLGMVVSTDIGTVGGCTVFGMASDPKTYLWNNICALIGEASPSIDRVTEKTRVGRGTIQRIRGKSEEVRTDSLVAIASALGVEVWELLVPPDSKRTALDSLGSQVTQLVTLFRLLPTDERRDELIVELNAEIASGAPGAAPSPANPFPGKSTRNHAATPSQKVGRAAKEDL